MQAHGADDIQRHIKIYMMVFGSLAVLTVVTVAVSYLRVSLPVAVAIAFLIAATKATMVACYFMHLISETKAIYSLLALSILLLLVMILIPTLSGSDMLVSAHVP